MVVAIGVKPRSVISTLEPSSIFRINRLFEAVASDLESRRS